MRKTLLLVGGDLCRRTAALLDGAQWNCIGLRRSAMPSDAQGVTWYQGDLLRPDSLRILRDKPFSQVTHILFAPSPDGRSEAHYKVYSEGLSTLLKSLSPQSLSALTRCVMVGSSAVWGPSDEWVDENTPVQKS